MTKKQLLLLTLYITYCSIICAQGDPCKEIIIELEEIHSKFSKIETKETMGKIDSIENFIPEDCYIGLTIKNNIEGRYHKSLGELDSAMVYFNRAGKFAEKSNNANQIKEVFHFKYLIMKTQSFAEKGLVLLDSAIQVKCPAGDVRCQKTNVKLVLNKGVALQQLGRPQEAIQILQNVEEEMNINKVSDSIYYVAIFNLMGNIYEEEFNDYRESLLYYKKALQYVAKNHRTKYLLYNNIGLRHRDLLNYDSSRVYFLKTIDNATIPRYKIMAYIGLGDIAIINKKYNRAIVYYTKGLDNSILASSLSREIESRALLAKAYYLNGNIKEAKKSMSKAEDKLSKADYNKRNSLEIERMSNLINIASYDPNLSYDFYDHLNLCDSIESDKRIDAIEKSVAKFEKKVLRDSLDRAVLLKENETQKVQNYRLSTLALILGLLLAGGVAYQFRRLFTGQKAKNEELVFKNQELESINQQLEKKTRTIENKVVADVKGVPSKIQFKSADKVYLLESEQIKYVQAEDDGTRVFYDDTSNWTDASLKEMSKQLPQDSFVQIFRSTIVNINHIGWVNTTSLKMKDGTELKISRTYKQRIKDAIKE